MRMKLTMIATRSNLLICETYVSHGGSCKSFCITFPLALIENFSLRILQNQHFNFYHP